MNIETGALITAVMAIIGGAVAYGMNRKADERQERDIIEMQKKIEGIDKWSRDHEEKAGVARLDFAQKVAGLEKEIELSAANHTSMMELIERVESAISKMDEKFDSLTKSVSEFMIRRGWETKGG